MLLFVLPTDPVMVVGSFFINHNVVLGETGRSLSDAAPPSALCQPITPLLFCVCVHVSHPRVHALPIFFLPA